MSQNFPVGFPDLQWRPAGEPDLWAALIARTAKVEKPAWFERRAHLDQLMRSTKNPPSANTVLGIDGAGIPRAYARSSKNPGGDKAFGFGCVDPEWQCRGVGTGLLGWLEARTRERFAAENGDGGAAPRLRIFMEQKHEHQARLFRKSGYTVVRYFNEMQRPLDLPLPEVVLGPDLELVTMTAEMGEPVRLAHNDTFRDHWGSEPRDRESWSLTVDDPQARPDLSAVVLDSATGEVAGYQLASHDDESGGTRGYLEGYKELLGVGRQYRGRGIAQALLADAMQRFAAAGMDIASLGVDTENPTGALALYTKMGYVAVNRSLAWDKEL